MGKMELWGNGEKWNLEKFWGKMEMVGEKITQKNLLLRIFLGGKRTQKNFEKMELRKILGKNGNGRGENKIQRKWSLEKYWGKM